MIEINQFKHGSGCGSVGKAVASDTGDPQLESRLRNCDEEMKIEKMSDREGPKVLNIYSKQTFLRRQRV